jgi:hypothetical protein
MNFTEMRENKINKWCLGSNFILSTVVKVDRIIVVPIKNQIYFHIVHGTIRCTVRGIRRLLTL